MDDGLDRKLFNDRAERIVIGGVLISGGKLLNNVDFLNAADFNSGVASVIFRAFKELYAHGIEIDSEGVAVTEILKQKEKGGQSLSQWDIVSYCDETPEVTGVLNAARIVKENSRKRRLISECELTIDTLKNGRAGSSVASEKLASSVLAISEDKDEAGFVHVKQAATEIYNDALETDPAKFGKTYRTGFTGMDKHIGNWPPGIHIIASGPKRGKSSLMLRIAWNMAKQGLYVSIASCEMTRKQLIAKLISAKIGEPVRKIFGRQVPKDKYNLLHESISEITKTPIFINDRTRDTNRIIAKVEAMHKDGVCDVLMVDYLQLLRMDITGKSSKNDAIGDITGKLHRLAVKCEMPIFLLSQINRTACDAGGKFRLSALRDSGNIEQDATTVSFMYWDYETLKDTGEDEMVDVEWYLGANRYGGCPSADLKFHRGNSQFYEIGGDNDA